MDVTKAKHWQDLNTLWNETANKKLSSMMSEERVQNLFFRNQYLSLDLSKSLVTEKVFSAFFGLAQETEFDKKKEALFAGKNINDTEKRPALHHALRSFSNEDFPYSLDVRKIAADCLQSIQTVYDRFFGDNNSIRQIVMAGIGGSITGPRLLSQALSPFKKKDAPIVRFLSGPEPGALDEIFSFDPKSTLFIIASKSFGTTETLDWQKRIWRHFETNEHFQKHCLAVTASPEKAKSAGFLPENIIPFPEWTGGRYSVWAPISLPVVFETSPEVFEKFLDGAAFMDRHFYKEKNETNLPFLMAALDIWYSNFAGFSTHALLPYHPRMALLTEYVQQLEMESNGKSYTPEGRCKTQTSGVVWGLPGTDCQHSFMQLLHQGTKIHPVEFVGVLNDPYDPEGFNDKLIANMLAQSAALMLGAEADEPYRYFPGDRPSSVLFLNEYTPQALGALLAFYEHRTFCEGALLNINSFDQWGVELGKKLAAGIVKGLEDTDQNWIENYDPSTRKLLQLYLKKGV